MNRANKAIGNMKFMGYRYGFGFLVNFFVFATVYKLFGFEWLIVVALADITRDLGIIVTRMFDKEFYERVK